MFTNEQLRTIFHRTCGHCHFCGDRLILKRYGKLSTGKGAWEADHVIQKAKGGSKSEANCLATCIPCNRLRWHRKGMDIRALLSLGVIVKEEIKKRSAVGRYLSHRLK